MCIELPKTTFVHSSWNSQPQQAAFMYKHKTVPGKQFQLSVSCVRCRISITVLLDNFCAPDSASTWARR
jgi:hypothetical protein